MRLGSSALSLKHSWSGSTPSLGSTPSATSINNFINFCAGQNITDGSPSRNRHCNPAPIGLLPSSNNIPSVKILNPKNGDIIPSGSPFTVSLGSKNFAGTFSTSAIQTYMTAPQQLDPQGNVMGHFHLSIEKLSSFNQTTPTDPSVFAVSRGIFNNPPSSEIPADLLEPGLYRAMVSLHTANHSPVMLPIAEHGGTDDAVYVGQSSLEECLVCLYWI